MPSDNRRCKVLASHTLGFARVVVPTELACEPGVIVPLVAVGPVKPGPTTPVVLGTPEAVGGR